MHNYFISTTFIPSPIGDIYIAATDAGIIKISIGNNSKLKFDEFLKKFLKINIAAISSDRIQTLFKNKLPNLLNIYRKQYFSVSHKKTNAKFSLHEKCYSDIYQQTQNKSNQLEILAITIHLLSDYFKGNNTKFNIPICLLGTEFQIKVWQTLSGIPYGSLMSYKEIAELLNSPKSARAVGQANKTNNIPIIIPCHRIIGSNNKLTGFSAGLKIKEFLINLEKN